MNWEQTMNSKYGYSFPNHKLGVPNQDPDFKGGFFRIIGNEKISGLVAGSLTFHIAPYVQLQLTVGNLGGDTTVASLSIEGRFPSELSVNLESDSGCSGVKMGVAGKFSGEIQGTGAAGLKNVFSSGNVLKLFSTNKKQISRPSCYPFSSNKKLRKREYIWDNTTLGAENEASLLGIQPYSHTKPRSLEKRADGFLYNLANAFSCPGGGDDDGDGNICDIKLGDDFADAFGGRDDEPSDHSLRKRFEDHHWDPALLEEVGQAVKEFKLGGGNLTDEEYWRHIRMVAEKHTHRAPSKRAVVDWVSPAPTGPLERRSLTRICGNNIVWYPGTYSSWPNQRRGMTVYERLRGCDDAPYMKTYPLTDTVPPRVNRNRDFATEHVLEIQTFNNFWIWVTDSAEHQPFAISNNQGNSRVGACRVLKEKFYDLNHAGLYRPISILALGVYPNNIDWPQNNAAEFIILENDVNQCKKAFMSNDPYRNERWMRTNSVPRQISALKSCFLVFKYLRDPTITAIFEAQVGRMTAGLRWLETVYIPRLDTNSIDPYPPNGYNLATSWNIYVKFVVARLNRVGEQFIRDNLARLMPDYGGDERPNETQDDLNIRKALNMLNTAYHNTFLPFNPNIP
ncbi:hypothetical protein AA313_de0201428 [Arthrobotrys entomopaga]|nr:hypothetical protein AA313_de0201428 [Arthrobotrys entomopaga]